MRGFEGLFPRGRSKSQNNDALPDRQFLQFEYCAIVKDDGIPVDTGGRGQLLELHVFAVLQFVLAAQTVANAIQPEACARWYAHRRYGAVWRVEELLKSAP